MKNIVLIGMPASGKTTVGKILAERIGYRYYDADRYLEKKEKMKIKDIFLEKGESYFRELESKYLKELSQKTKIVISTGGGAVKNEENMKILKKNGKIVFLNRKLEDIAKENHEHRPLLKNKENIRKLYIERIDLYNKYADIKIENDKILDEVVNEVIINLKI